LKFNLNTLKTIIFDIGGVVLNLDIAKSAEAFAQLGKVSPEQVLESFRGNPVFPAFERGEISAEVFRNEIRALLNNNLMSSDIDAAWNAMLLDLPTDRLNLISELRNRFQTMVLSNTNEIHFTAFKDIVATTTGGISFENYFDAAYYSHIVGLRKPEKEIFQYVLDEHKLDPAATLFIDDMRANTQMAECLGLQTWHLVDQKELMTVFNYG
jgi:putative hydrolase of the HAD superfamily